MQVGDEVQEVIPPHAFGRITEMGDGMAYMKGDEWGEWEAPIETLTKK